MPTHECSNASPDQGRRDFIKGTIGFAVIATPVAGTEVCLAESVEDKANRLAWELADLLNDYGRGTSYAVVHPSKQEKFAVAFLKMRPV